MLAPHIDVLFERGFITFTDDGALVAAPDLAEATVTTLGLPRNTNVGPFHSEQAAFLEKHRTGIFQD